MLTGSDLLTKVKELGDVSKSDLVRACGYVSGKKDGGDRLNFTAMLGLKSGDEFEIKLGRKNVWWIGDTGGMRENCAALDLQNQIASMVNSVARTAHALSAHNPELPRQPARRIHRGTILAISIPQQLYRLQKLLLHQGRVVHPSK
jgi:hypothetical protein